MEERKHEQPSRMLCQVCGGICAPEDSACLNCGSHDLTPLPSKAFGLKPENYHENRPSAKGDTTIPSGMKKTTGESQ